jgi:TIR domain
MPTVFLSYRRGDTGGEAGRLADTFQHRIGGSLVFRDVADIPLGAQFDSMLDKELTAAKIVLVLIGPTWLGELQQRLKQSDIDYLRVEVAAALARGKRVIPLLLNGATLPPVHALPEDLGALAKRQAMTLRDESWNQDVDRLIDAIGRPYRWNIVALRAVFALVAIVVAVKLLVPMLPDEYANDVVFVRILVASLAGAYALVEFAVAIRHFRKLKREYQS